MLSQLPSETAAKALLRGEPGGLSSVLYWTLFRAGVIGAGLYAAGEREHLLKYSVAAAAAVELGVLWFAWRDET